MTTSAIEMKLATRMTYDAAKAVLEAVEALQGEYPGLAAQIRPSLQAAQESLSAATQADELAYHQLEAR